MLKEKERYDITDPENYAAKRYNYHIGCVYRVKKGFWLFKEEFNVSSSLYVTTSELLNTQESVEKTRKSLLEQISRRHNVEELIIMGWNLMTG